MHNGCQSGLADWQKTCRVDFSALGPDSTPLCWGKGDVGALKVSLEAILSSHRSSPNLGKCLPLLCKKILRRKPGECSRLGSAVELRSRYNGNQIAGSLCRGFSIDDGHPTGPPSRPCGSAEPRARGGRCSNHLAAVAASY